MSPRGPFGSESRFREAYAKGLEQVLAAPGIGGLVLAYANAALDQGLADRLLPLLRAGHARFADENRRALTSSRRIAVSADDWAVFRRLEEMFAEGLPIVEWRSVGPWEVQFNPWRALRPPRVSQDRVSGISAPFDRQAFNFNRRFLRRETIWAGELLGKRVDLLYNKFPFAELHALLVPDRSSNRPQLLDSRYHRYAWELANRLGQCIPGIGLGYNSYGACASVNHLHFQLFVRSASLPVTRWFWNQNGGQSTYPTECERCENVDKAWERISALHAERCSYNLIYLPGLAYCLPRRRQGTYPPIPWTSGSAWYELAGGVVVHRRDHFLDLGEPDIEAALRSLSLESSPLAAVSALGPRRVGSGFLRSARD